MGNIAFELLSRNDLIAIMMMVALVSIIAILGCCLSIRKRLAEEAGAREQLHALVNEMKPYLINIREQDIMVRAAAIKSTRAASQVQSLLDRAKRSRHVPRPAIPSSASAAATATRQPISVRHHGSLKR